MYSISQGTFTMLQLIGQPRWSEAGAYVRVQAWWIILQQFEHASMTGTGSYVTDTLSCQQQRKI